MLLRPPGVRAGPPVPPGLRVERVTGAGALRDWEQVAVDGFPYRELQPYRPGALLDEAGPGRRAAGCGSATSTTGQSASARCSWTPGWRSFSLGVTLPEARRAEATGRPWRGAAAGRARPAVRGGVQRR